MLAFSPGTLFGERYEIVRQIGTGGMGAVYEVLHRETRRRRALKVMLPTLLVDDDMRRRFALEAVVTAEIESEHIVEIFDAGIDRDTGAPFIVMELLRGAAVSERLDRGERYTLAETVDLLGQAARALAKTHAAGVVHRDLKPENLFVTRREDGTARVKILDFGIAKLMQDGAASKPQTRSVGTPLYMAPEQLSGEAKRIGPAADAWSLAMVAYAMLVGEAYFEEEGRKSENVLALLLKVSRGAVEPARARALRTGVALPEPFDAWFARATALEPAERFSSALELVESLGQIQGEPAYVERPARALGRTAASAVTGDAWEGPTGPRGTVKLGASIADEPTELDDRVASRSGAHATHAGVTGSASPAPRPRNRALLVSAAIGLVAASVVGARALGVGEGGDGVAAVPPPPPSAEVHGAAASTAPPEAEPRVLPGAPASATPTATPSASASASPRPSSAPSAAPPVGAGPVVARPKPPAPTAPATASPSPPTTGAPVWTVR